MKQPVEILEETVSNLNTLRETYSKRFLGLYRFKTQIANIDKIIEDVEIVKEYLNLSNMFSIAIEKGTVHKVGVGGDDDKLQ